MPGQQADYAKTKQPRSVTKYGALIKQGIRQRTKSKVKACNVNLPPKRHPIPAEIKRNDACTL